MTKLPILLLLIACGSWLRAGGAWRAVRTATPPRLDGRLEDAAWVEAPVLRDFTQNLPMLGQPSRKRTEVRVLYDDHYLYVGARMHHEVGRADVVRQVHRRDQSSASDWFAFFVDSAHDHRSAFSFMVNASNVQRDGLHFDDGSEDWAWDGVWESAVNVDPDGWTAELRIPIALLRFHPQAGAQTWGVNVGRRDEGREREVSYWYSPARGENAWVSRFYHLEGLEGLKPQPRREWIPYVSVQRKFETAQSYDDRGWTRRAGLDAHLGLNTYSQLDLTLRPDFGQVEVDQAVLNLTTVETMFPEKRPFFLEGMEIFQLPGAKLFYSRRIGRGLEAPPPGLDVLEWPRAAEIAAAGKYTAKYPGGLSLGVLGAGMEAARANWRDETGREVRSEVAPSTSAAVVRATQALDGRGSYVGAFGSWLSQAGAGGRRAGVAALDGAWRSKDGSARLEGLYAHSEAGPKGAAQAGDFLKIHLVKAWGQGWNLDGNAFAVSRDFNPNDLGYLDRPDRKGWTFDLDRRWDIQKGVFRNPMWRFTLLDFRDQAGRPYMQYVESWAKTEFTNDWAVFGGGGQMATVYDDREMRTFREAEKKYLRLAGCPWAFVGLDSPPNRRWVVNLIWNHVWREGGSKHEIEFAQTFKPMPRAELQLKTSYTRAEGEWHWMETQGGTPIRGMRKLGYMDQVMRLSYAFSPTLTVQLFSQWLAGNWSFRDPQAYVDDATWTPGAQPLEPTAASDRLWNLNLIGRWEFRPGSALFVVYTHGVATGELINDRASLSPVRDLAYLRRLPSDDVVQVKLSWLFR